QPLAPNRVRNVCRMVYKTNGRTWPRAMGQQTERGTNGPETLPEGEPASQAWATPKWALGGQVAGRHDSVGWNDRTSVQVGSPRNGRGLPDTKARTARLRSPFIHDQQSNLQS